MGGHTIISFDPISKRLSSNIYEISVESYLTISMQYEPLNASALWNFYCSSINFVVLWFSRYEHCVTRSHSLMINVFRDFPAM